MVFPFHAWNARRPAAVRRPSSPSVYIDARTVSKAARSLSYAAVHAATAAEGEAQIRSGARTWSRAKSPR